MCPACVFKLVDPYKLRDAAADAGTLAHSMIEACIKKQPQPDISKVETDTLKKACQAYDNYLEWANQMKVELVTMEVPLVSERWQAGTTCDVIALVAGKLSIVEIKTSNDVYAEMLVQCAFQVEAWNEVHPWHSPTSVGQPIQAVHLLKLGKEEATFSHHFFAPEVLAPAFEAWKCARQLEDCKKQLEKLI